MKTAIKSTGTLVDELLTTDLKIAAGMDAQERRHALANLVTGRTVVLLGRMDEYRLFQRIMAELKEILTECWNAQETIMELPNAEDCSQDQLLALGVAAKTAQHTNAARNRLIRRLDELVEETGRTQLAKTYDKEG